MLKKFITDSLLFSLSNMGFSALRQIIFLPFLFSYSESAFTKIVLLFLLADLMVFAFGASVADYYVRLCKEGKKSNYEFVLLKIYLIPSFIFSAFIFYYYVDSLYIVMVMSLYVYLYSRNTYYLKLLFNKLIFGENYIYVGFKSVSLVITITAIYFINMDSQDIILTLVNLLFLSELLYSLRLARLTNGLIKPEKIYFNDYISEIKNIFGFVIIYVLGGALLRGDGLIVEFKNGAIFAEYMQVITVVNFFLLPVIAMTSSSVNSYLIKVPTYQVRANRLKIIAVLLAVSAVIGIVFYYGSGLVLHRLYPQNLLISKYKIEFSFMLGMLMMHSILKIIALRYVNINNLIMINIIGLVLIGFSLIMVNELIVILMIFYIIRTLIFFASLYMPMSN